jgi:hypothetical protein
MKLIGVFQGKQAKHNTQILNVLYDNGPLTAWEITGKIRNIGKVSLHATLTKRLRSLEKKEYVAKAGKKWCFRFKGIIAAILSQKNPRPLSNKWADLIDSFSQNVEEHFSELSETTVHAGGVTIRPFEAIRETGHTIRTFDEWIALSNFIKGLIEKGVVNFDVISNQTLMTVMLSEFTDEQLKTVKGWDVKESTSEPDDNKKGIDH